MKTNCKNCKKEINKKPWEIKKGGNLFCSRTCYSTYNPKTVEVLCGVCNKKLIKYPSDIKKSKSGNLYCSSSCSAIAANKSRFGKGHASYRRQAFESREIKCEECGWDKEHGVLVVHHINRNRKDHTLTNLKILCPTCHSLEHFYKQDGIFTK